MRGPPVGTMRRRCGLVAAVWRVHVGAVLLVRDGAQLGAEPRVHTSACPPLAACVPQRDVARADGLAQQLALIRQRVEELLSLLQHVADQVGRPMPDGDELGTLGGRPTLSRPPPPPPRPSRCPCCRCSCKTGCCWRLCCASRYAGRIDVKMAELERLQDRFATSLQVHMRAKRFSASAVISVRGAGAFWERYVGDDKARVALSDLVAAYRAHQAGMGDDDNAGPELAPAVAEFLFVDRAVVSASIADAVSVHRFNDVVLAYGWPLGSNPDGASTASDSGAGVGTATGAAAVASPRSAVSMGSSESKATTPKAAKAKALTALPLPSEMDALRLMADQLFTARRFEEAAAAYTRVLQSVSVLRAPDLAKHHALVHRGLARLRCGRLELAVADADAAREVGCAYVEHESLAAQAALAQHNWDAAWDLADKALARRRAKVSHRVRQAAAGAGGAESGGSGGGGAGSGAGAGASNGEAKGGGDSGAGDGAAVPQEFKVMPSVPADVLRHVDRFTRRSAEAMGFPRAAPPAARADSVASLLQEVKTRAASRRVRAPSPTPAASGSTPLLGPSPGPSARRGKLDSYDAVDPDVPRLGPPHPNEDCFINGESLRGCVPLGARVLLGGTTSPGFVALLCPNSHRHRRRGSRENEPAAPGDVGRVHRHIRDNGGPGLPHGRRRRHPRRCRRPH